MLLARGVNPNAVYNNDLTALMWAAGFGKTATVKALLAAGAKPQMRDNRGKTAADMAREANFAETAALLDAAGRVDRRRAATPARRDPAPNCAARRPSPSSSSTAAQSCAARAQQIVERERVVRRASRG